MAPRERRTIVLGLCAVAAAWGALRGVPHARAAGLGLRERRVVASVALSRAKEALALEPLARESLGVRAARLVAWAPRLFGGTTPSEAAAELSSLVSGTASLHHVRIIRQDARPDSSASIFVRLTLRLEAEGDVEGVMSWVAALEESPRLVEVQSLNISAPDPATSAAQPERLHAELVLVGWGAVGHPPGS